MDVAERAKDPAWALVRLVLGWAQMAGAATAGLLLVTSGVTPLVIEVTAVTAVFLVLSLVLFRRR